MRLADLAAELGRDVDGDPEIRITGVAPLDSAGPADLSFVRSAQFATSLSSTRAGAVIAADDIDAGGRPTIRSPNPGLDFSRAARCLLPAGAGTGFLGGGVHCWLCFHVWVERISWSVA